MEFPNMMRPSFASRKRTKLQFQEKIPDRHIMIYLDDRNYLLEYDSEIKSAIISESLSK